MKSGIAGRRVWAVVLVAALLVVVSGLLELGSVVRLATERAATECELITHTIRRQLDFLAAERPFADLAELGRDPRLAMVLSDAIAHAPSALHVAVCDTAGVAAAHSLPSNVGKRMERYPPLPRAENLADAFRVLWLLRDSGSLFESHTALVRNERPFGTIRVIVTGTFLWDSVEHSFWRGVVVAVVLVALAIGMGVLLSRLVIGRLRVLEAGVAAIREGRFEPTLPESGADEFSRLARELNLLGQEFEEKRQRAGAGQTVNRAADLLGDGILVVDAAGEVILVNTPACRWLHIDPAASQGQRLDALVGPAHPLIALTSRLRESEERTLSVMLADGGVDGTRDSLVAVGHRIAEAGAPVAGTLIEIKKASDQAALHSLVDQSRVLTRLGEMAAGVAHELRNPLQTLSLELETVAAAARRDPAEVQAHVRSAAEKIRRLDRAISGFLKIARLRPSKVERIRMDVFLEEIRDSLEADANLAGLEIELAIDTPAPEVVADPQVLRQAVGNLVRNSIQALPSRDKKIVLRCGRAPAADSPRRWVTIAVADTGPGIASEHRERVFDLFFTTRPEGTGVGLALVRQAAELHGGEVAIESEVGVGTTVVIHLPEHEGSAG
jgi:signal transduction histidine kinase/HAMP domain-containing protein